MFRKLLLGLVLLALIGAGGWYGWRWYTTPSPPEIPLDGVNENVAARINKAIEEVRAQPRSARPWGELSMLLMANGYTDQAIPCLVQAQRLAPEDPRWIYYHGLLLGLSNPHVGIPKLRQALALTQLPEHREGILTNLALILIEEGEFEEAEQHLNSLQEISGESAAVHFGRGLLALGRGDRDRARNLLSKVTDSLFARKRACSQLASLTEGNKGLAQKYLEQASKFPNDQPWPDPLYAEVQNYRIDPLERFAPYFELNNQGRTAEALAFLRQFTAENPDEVSCFTLGFTLLGLQQYEEAEKALRQALQFNPRNVKAHLFLGNSLYHQGEKRLKEKGGREQAMELFRQAVLAEDKTLSFQYENAHAHMTRGLALKHLGRKKEAMAALREAVLVGSELADIHQALGEALAEEGQVREALEHLENAVRIAKPDDLRPRQALEKWKAKLKPDARPDGAGKKAPGGASKPEGPM